MTRVREVRMEVKETPKKEMDIPPFETYFMTSHMTLSSASLPAAARLKEISLTVSPIAAKRLTQPKPSRLTLGLSAF